MACPPAHSSYTDEKFHACSLKKPFFRPVSVGKQLTLGTGKKNAHMSVGFVLHSFSSLLSSNVYEFPKFTECELSAGLSLVQLSGTSLLLPGMPITQT